MAGLACAGALAAAGLAVTVFEKSRGPGGRAATRIARGADAFLSTWPHAVSECCVLLALVERRADGFQIDLWDNPFDVA